MPDVEELDAILDRYTRAGRRQAVWLAFVISVPVFLISALIVVNARREKDLMAERGHQLSQQVDVLLKGPVEVYHRPVRLGSAVLIAAEEVEQSASDPSVRPEEVQDALKKLADAIKEIDDRQLFLRDSQATVDRPDADANEPEAILWNDRIAACILDIRNQGEAFRKSSADELARGASQESETQTAKDVGPLRTDVISLGKHCKQAWLRDISGNLSQEINAQLKARIYGEALAAVSKPLDSKSPPPEDRKKFWELYWGDMLLVESDEVAGKMVTYGNLLGHRNARVFDAETIAKLSKAAQKLKEQIDKELRAGDVAK